MRILVESLKRLYESGRVTKEELLDRVASGKISQIHFPPIIPNGRFTHCPHRRLHEANGPNTDVPFPVFPFSKTAEMGFVFDDVHHYPLHGIHRPKEATGNSYHLPTGKQIAGIYRTDRNSLFSKYFFGYFVLPNRQI